MTIEIPVTRHPANRGAVWVLVLSFLAVFVFQLWFLGFWPQTARADDSVLSKPYTEALAKGQSYLLQQPDSRLVSAKDPFAASTRSLLIWDTSYFRGHFYMYFGIVPFVLFLVPFCLISGAAPGPSLAILVFLAGGFAAYGGLLYVAQRAWLRRSSNGILALAYLSLIFSSGTLPLMSRPAIFEIENAAAFCMFGFGLLFLAAAETRPGRNSVFPTLAALFFGLTMGCRPNYFPAVGVCCSWLVFGRIIQRQEQESKPATVGLIGPLLAIVIVAYGLGWWNYHRFGSLTDFGLKHTVSEDPAQTRSLASVKNLPYGLSRYSVGLPRLGHYFPFIEGQKRTLFMPARDQEESNQVYGFLVLSPALLFSFAIVRRRSVARGLKVMLALGAASFAGNFLFLSSVTMSCYRYPADFVPPLALTAAFGMLALAEDTGCMVTGLLLTPLVAWSALSAICVAFSIAVNANSFPARRPASFRAASEVLNKPTYLYERLSQSGPTAQQIRLRFPANRLGKSEPVEVLGEAGAQDFIYVYYAGPNLIRLGFMSSGLQDIQSRLVAVDFKEDHLLEIYLGSLLPPDGDPNIEAIPQADLDLARKAIYLKMDNAAVLDSTAEFHRPRAKIQIGRSVDDNAFGPRFTGEIEAVEFPSINRLFESARWRKSAYIMPVFEFTLPPMPVGVFDPIVSLGSPGTGAELLVENLPANNARLVWLNGDGSRIQGQPFQIVAGRLLSVRVEAGELLPPFSSTLWPVGITPDEKKRLKHRLIVFLQGKPSIEAQCAESDIPPDMVSPGIDALTSLAGVLPSFPGRLRLLSPHYDENHASPH